MNNVILEVNVNNVLKNLEYLKSKNPNKEICIPLKANAYGLGYELIDFLLDEGYYFYAVSTIDEAIYIREKSKKAKILLFSAIFKEDIQIALKNDITITVYDFEILNEIPNELKFHLKFDVGMGRIGFLEDKVDEIKEIVKKRNLNVEGIYSHLPKSYDSSYSKGQINKFEKIVEEFKAFDIKYIHLYNGAGCLLYNTKFDNLIRPGLATYGYLESKYLKEELCKDILPTITLKAKVSLQKDYTGPIGYDGIEQANGEVLTIPLGYHDGFKQSYRGYNIPGVGKIVGKICMCQTMVLKEKDQNIQKGDYVNLIYKDEIYNLCEYSKVSVYEILATLGNRIKRKYIKE